MSGLEVATVGETSLPVCSSAGDFPSVIKASPVDESASLEAGESTKGLSMGISAGAGRCWSPFGEAWVVLMYSLVLYLSDFFSTATLEVWGIGLSK